MTMGFWDLVIFGIGFGTLLGLVVSLPAFIIVMSFFLITGTSLAVWLAIPPQTVIVAALGSIVASQIGYVAAICIRILHHLKRCKAAAARDARQSTSEQGER